VTRTPLLFTGVLAPAATGISSSRRRLDTGPSGYLRRPSEMMTSASVALDLRTDVIRHSSRRTGMIRHPRSPERCEPSGRGD